MVPSSRVYLCVLLACVLLLGGLIAEAPAATPTATAAGLSSRVIHHSPQYPGATTWPGIWTMPGGDLVVAFDQVTGPVDPAGREPMPQPLLAALERAVVDPRRDFWGLDQAVKSLRSTDGGETWLPDREDPFRALAPDRRTPQGTVAAADGTLIRPVDGRERRFDPDVPHTTYLQRLAPGAPEWSAPQALGDPATTTTRLSRIRLLRDARLLAVGLRWPVPTGAPQADLDAAEPDLLALVSAAAA